MRVDAAHRKLRAATRAGTSRLRGLLTPRERQPTDLPPVCESALQWALDHPHADVQRLRPPMTIHRRAPRTRDPAAQQYFSSFPPAYVLPEKYLARLPG